MVSRYFQRNGDYIVQLFENKTEGLFTPKNGAPVSVRLVFNDRHQDIDINKHKYGAPKPVAWIKTGSINPTYKDMLTIDGANYWIVEVKNDGIKATTELLLQLIE